MTFSHENSTWLYTNALADEFARAGVEHICLSPGSRSTPLAMSFAQSGKFRLWVHLDERSCAFFGLGLAKASCQPVVLLCTSGTAAANFFPAVVEASLAHVPLLVLTSDRPPELRDTGAPQTIDQIKLYGAYPKWFAELALPEGTAAMLRYVRTLACRAVARAIESPAGVVHLNLPFREPLVPFPVQVEPAEDEREAYLGRANGKPYASIPTAKKQPEVTTLQLLAPQLAASERGLIVAGMQNDNRFPEAVAALAARCGYPILADPLSGVRCGEHNRAYVIDAYDAFLRDENVGRGLAPEIVLRFGAIPTSKPLLMYLHAHASARQILVGDGEWADPAQIASDAVRADPVVVCEVLTQELQDFRRDSTWLSKWREINTRAGCAAEAQVSNFDEMFEGRVISELAGCLPDGTTCFVSSSMPVRDLDTFLPSNERRVRFLSNRGANGIDGVISTALGAGAAIGGPLVLVVGDLAFYHDMNGLYAANKYNLQALIILVNNDGGGIFSFLPQANYPEHFEELFGTPHGLNLQPAASLYGGTFRQVGDWESFRAAVADGLRAGGLQIIEVKTDRQRNVTMHREVWRAVSSAISGSADEISPSDKLRLGSK